MKANTRIRKQIPLFGPKKHYFHEVSIPHQYCHYRSSHSLFSDSISQTKHVSVFTHHQTHHKPPGEPCAPIRTILVVGFREHADSSSGSDPKLFKINRMESDKYAKELDVAVRVVHMACSMCQSVQKGLVSGSSNQVKSKHDDSPVTVADWSVQATVSWILSESFGSQNVSIIAEEDVQTLSEADSVGLLEMVVTTVNKTLAKAPNFGLNGPGQALEAPQVLEAINRCNSTGGPVGKHWVLDPVDGTLGFLRGDQYAVALALIDDGQVVIGVLGCPNYPTKKESLHNRKKPDGYISSPDSSEKGCVMYTRRGSGEAWMHPLIHGDEKFDWSNLAKLIRVSSIDDPALATFCEPVEETNSDHSFTAKLANNVGLSNKPLRVYSMVKYAAIARGDAEIYMKFARAGYKEKIWDHAAGVLIVEEAGGVVTDAGGKPLNFSRGMYLEGLDRGIVACSGVKLHKKFIGAIYASWDSSNL